MEDQKPFKLEDFTFEAYIAREKAARLEKLPEIREGLPNGGADASDAQIEAVLLSEFEDESFMAMYRERYEEKRRELEEMVRMLTEHGC